MKYTLNHLHLICKDLDGMVTFLTDVLGGELVERRKFGVSDGAVVMHGGLKINLRVERVTDGIETDSAKTRYGYDHLGFQVENLEAAVKEFEDKGYPIMIRPTDAGNLFFAFIKGPENITVEIMQLKD